jgi:hypothetical protein
MRRTASRGGSSGTRRGSRSRRNSQAFGSSPTRRELPSTFSLRSGVSATAPSSRQLLRQKRIRIDPVSRPGAPTNTRRVCRGTLCRSRATSDATRLLVEKRTLSLPKISSGLFLLFDLRCTLNQASRSSTTRPWTSVRRKSRPAYRYVKRS